jgi:hypothetical protein
METSLLWSYRQRLEAKRSVGTPENLFEVLTPDWLTYSSEIYDPTPIKRGVYNNGQNHWALALGNITISWVWDIANKSNTTCIVGATSLRDFECSDLLDRHKLGITQLSVEDIQEVGMSLSSEVFSQQDRRFLMWVCWMSSCPMEPADGLYIRTLVSHPRTTRKT